LLEDLYPLIDNDLELSREDFIENVLRMAEIDGSLYYVFPTFMVFTIKGNPNVLGNEPGWNLNEFIDVLNENPDADIPLGAYWTNELFLDYAISHSIDCFIDLDAGTVDFDNEDFIKLLEVANTFPSVGLEWGDFDEFDDIATGRQIMSPFHFTGFIEYYMYRGVFGGELVFKGFPSMNGSGNSITPRPALAITSVSGNKEGAWSFIRSVMTESWQRREVTQSSNRIPSNKAVLDWMIESAMNKPEHTIGIGGIEVTVPPLSEDEKNRFLEMIYSATTTRSVDNGLSSLMNIINESASDYFAGRITAKDTARIIQSRTSILVSEQFG